MDERERLMKLISDMPKEQTVAEMADYLLENGVIVPPVKVGDEVFGIFYLINSGVWQMSSGKHIVTQMHINKNGVRIVVTNRYGSIEPSDFGDTVFLTREEAEKALAERNVKK